MAKCIHRQNFTFNTHGKEFQFTLETFKETDCWRDRVDIDTRIGTLWQARVDMIHIKTKKPNDTVRVRLWNGHYVSGKDLLCSYEPDQSEKRIKCYWIDSPIFFTKFGWKDDHPKLQRNASTDTQDMQLSELDRHALQGSIDERDQAAIRAAMTDDFKSD